MTPIAELLTILSNHHNNPDVVSFLTRRIPNFVSNETPGESYTKWCASLLNDSKGDNLKEYIQHRSIILHDEIQRAFPSLLPTDLICNGQEECLMCQ